MSRMASFKETSSCPVCALRDHTGEQYSAGVNTRDRADVLNAENASFQLTPIIRYPDEDFRSQVFRWYLKVRVRSSCIPRQA